MQSRVVCICVLKRIGSLAKLEMPRLRSLSYSFCMAICTFAGRPLQCGVALVVQALHYKLHNRFTDVRHPSLCHCIPPGGW